MQPPLLTWCAELARAAGCGVHYPDVRQCDSRGGHRQHRQDTVGQAVRQVRGQPKLAVVLRWVGGGWVGGSLMGAACLPAGSLCGCAGEGCSGEERARLECWNHAGTVAAARQSLLKKGRYVQAGARRRQYCCCSPVQLHVTLAGPINPSLRPSLILPLPACLPACPPGPACWCSVHLGTC